MINNVQRISIRIILSVCLINLGTVMLAITPKSLTINYASISSLQTLNIFTPESYSDMKDSKMQNMHSYPVIIFIGNENITPVSVPAPLSYALQNGYAVVTVGYRAIFPQCIQDINAAIRWIKANSDMYNLHRNKIFLWGIENGGYIALVAGLSGTYLKGVSSIQDFGTDSQIMAVQQNEQRNINNVDVLNSMWNDKNIPVDNKQSKKVLTQNTEVLGIINFCGLLDSPWRLPDKLNNAQSLISSPEIYLTPESPAIFAIYSSLDDKTILNTVDSIHNKIQKLSGSNNLAETIIIKDAKSVDNIFFDNAIIEKTLTYMNELIR